MIGEIIKGTTPVSSFQPSQDVVDLTSIVQKDYYEGDRILHTSWLELNDRSVIDDENNGQMMFNAFVDESDTDINESWKYKGTRSIARNKAIAMHAQLTANFLFPLYSAQNENDEIDKDFSEVMRDVVEWMTNPTVYNYRQSFLQLVFAMETDPVVYLSAEYKEVMQKIKVKNEDGTMSTTEILDQVASGFNAPIKGASQVLITNAYERNIQRQKAIIEREWVEISEAEKIFGDHDNFGFVEKGMRSVYSVDDGLFYDIKDDDHPNLVAIETWKMRKEDSEVPFVGGIYMGDDNIEANPIKHRDNRNAPKYNVIPFGFSRIGNHFFYYKSMMNALQWDNQFADALDEVWMNGIILENEMPLAFFGSEKIDSEVVFPNSVITFENPDAKVTPLLPPKNFAAAIQGMREREKSMDEGSIDKVTAGQRPDADEKVGNVARAQANARKTIAGTMKTLAESMIQYGDLMKDIVLNNITIPEVEELVG